MARFIEKTLLKTQFELTEKNLAPDIDIYTGCKSMYELMFAMYNYMEGYMDKKMHKVTEKMKVAEKDIKKGKAKAAVKVLKGAEKKNEKLVKIDKNVRDPIIKKAKMGKC